MNVTLQDRYRQQLQHLTDRVGGDLTTVAAETNRPSGGQADGAITNAPLHLADMGTDEFLFDMNATLLENESYLMGEAVDAMRRLNGGSFGDCERCHQPISSERLDALPYARHCVECAAKEQGGPAVNLNVGRPLTPADTLAPEGDMEEDRPRRAKSGYNGAASNGSYHGDVHAAGTAGGGTAMGGLAGTNEGHGDPTVVDLQAAAGSGTFDLDDAREDDGEPLDAQAED